jgi:hypothetical protein
MYVLYAINAAGFIVSSRIFPSCMLMCCGRSI